MALTVTTSRRTTAGTFHIWVGDVTFDAAYVTGGLSFTPANLGLTSILAVQGSFARKSDNAKGVVVSYDATNKKLLAFGKAASTTGVTEIDADTDLSAYALRIVVFGT